MSIMSGEELLAWMEEQSRNPDPSRFVHDDGWEDFLIKYREAEYKKARHRIFRGNATKRRRKIKGREFKRCSQNI